MKADPKDSSLSSALDTLSEAMSDYWYAEGRLRGAREDAYEAIRRAHTAGASLRAIAEATAMSHQRVAQIVGYQPPPPPAVREAIAKIERVSGPVSADES